MAFLKKLAASEHIRVDVKSEKFLGKEPISVRLILQTGTKYIVIAKDGIESRSTYRRGSEVVVNATLADAEQLYFSRLQPNLATRVGNSNAIWQKSGVVKGSILTQIGETRITSQSQTADILMEQLELVPSMDLFWDVPQPYTEDANSITLIPALAKVVLEEVDAHCVAVVIEGTKEKLYIDMLKLQEPALMEPVAIWQPIKLKEGMKCIIMHDILGVMEFDIDEDEEEVDIFSSTVVEILRVDKKKNLAEIVICAEPDDKWTIKLSSKEGRPALRPIDTPKLCIHYPESDDEGDPTPKMGFKFDADEIAAFTSTPVDAGESEAKVVIRKAKAPKRRGKAKAKTKKKVGDEDECSAEPTKKSTRTTKSQPSKTSGVQESELGETGEVKKTKSKSKKSKPQAGSDDEGSGDDAKKSKVRKTKTGVKKSKKSKATEENED